jgi:hypothetical protein
VSIILIHSDSVTICVSKKEANVSILLAVKQIDFSSGSLINLKI